MPIKILMSKLWPKAGGRTRAVMVRNESILKNVSNKIEMYIMERTDDPEERISEAKKRFGTQFDIKDIFEQLRYIKSNKTEFYSNVGYIMSRINVFSEIRFEIKEDTKLVILLKNDEKILSFYNKDGLSQFIYEGNNNAKVDYLISNSKLIIGFEESRRKFRLINDSHGRIISLGKYDNQGKNYISEQYYNIYGELVFEFITQIQDRNRKFYLYIDDGKIFQGKNSEKEMTSYLWNRFLNIQEGDTVIVDEPRFYSFLLKVGPAPTNRIFYFHWHDFGDTEKSVLQDMSVKKKVVFLTNYQRLEFLNKAQVTENNTLQTVVIDNFLELPNLTVQRSNDGYIRILFIGRLTPEKNVQRVINGFNDFYRSNKNARLVIIGDGKSKIELQELVKKLEISDVVKFTGNILSPYESEFVKKVDLALLTPKKEAYGLVFPELISRGIPVVTVDAPYGPRNWIKEDNGKLLPYDASFEDISCAIKDLLKLDISPEIVSNSINIKKINNTVIEKLVSLLKKT